MRYYESALSLGTVLSYNIVQLADYIFSTLTARSLLGRRPCRQNGAHPLSQQAELRRRPEFDVARFTRR